MTTPSGEVRPAAARVADVALFVADVAKMFAGVLRDERVPGSDKALAAAFLAAGLSPLDAIPVFGEAQLLAMTALATRQIVKAAGEDVLREHWQGSEQGFASLMFVVDTGLRPMRMFRRSFGRAFERARADASVRRG
ncbi:MAG TPA: hypothetical protein VF288_05160 [Mycobacteriales bacterium]